MKICKFQHSGICCNSGSDFFKGDCKNCRCQIPITNAEHLRRYLSDDNSLACFLSAFVALLEAPRPVFEEVERGSRYADAWEKWLKQPAEEDIWASTNPT